MKPDERILEKQLRRIIRGESVDSSLLAYHWRGLGRAGDQIVVRALNRAGGWESFSRNATQQPAIRELAQGLSQTVGISQSGLEILRREGLFQESDAQAVQQALLIVQQIESAHQVEWQSLQELLQTDPNLLDGVLLLLESSIAESSAQFAHSLLDRGFSREQETRIRKLLYHFRQKGIRPEIAATDAQTARELFFFGENKLPLWQPVLYFRPHSAFAATGDLLILRILEGSECAPAEQQRNLALNQASMQQIAERYSAQLTKQLGIQIQFQAIDPAHARYLLRLSLELISVSSGRQPLQDFLKFIGPDPAQNPFVSLNEAQPGTFANSDLLIHEPYFAHWTLNPHDIEEYLAQLAAQEKGPIILTGTALVAKKQEIRTRFFQKVFTITERSILAFAFRKAALFLRNSNTAASATAMYWAGQLEDPELRPEDIEIARALFDRTAELALAQQKAKQEEERKSSLIVTPDEFRKKVR
ncbi:hypothetical protein L0222_20660 [bacterium]|nr:hypothetical protein [bacterium]